MLPGYDIAKAAQVVAFFALKSGGEINVLKLAKLLYLAEREFMRKYDEPMFYDKLASLPDGPVTSVTLNLINGSIDDSVWSTFVTPRDGYSVAATGEVQNGRQLDELSKADIEILNALWDQFGDFDRYELRDWTHRKENVPEWKDPNGSSTPISHKDVFEVLGKDDVELLTTKIEERRELAKALSLAE